VVGGDRHFHPRRLFGITVPNIIILGNKTSMFEVKMRLALIQSLFYPTQAIHVHEVDLHDDVRCLLKNVIVEAPPLFTTGVGFGGWPPVYKLLRWPRGGRSAFY
jgi:hypothetical protein